MTNNNRKIKFAVVGCGHIGKRHAEMINKNPEAELVALCDVRTKEELGLNSLQVPLFADMESMFNSEIDIDVVNICTANGLHASHSLLALSHNKHVVVEKPLGLHKSNCEEVIYKALNLSKQVFVLC